MKRTFIIAAIAIAVAAAAYYANSALKQRPAPEAALSNKASFDAKNSTFSIDGNLVTLVNGEARTVAAPGSATQVTTRYFGHEAAGDLDGDGREDAAFLVTQDGGGSGLFYYAVAALRTDDGYKTTNAFLIGDRIAPRSMAIPADSTKLHVRYADRKPDEPMSAQPSVETEKVLWVTPTGVLRSETANEDLAIAWRFASATETEGIPRTAVTVTIGDIAYEMGAFAGSCNEIGESGGIDGKGLLAGELSAVQCWFAGGGNEIGVFAHEDGGFEILVGELSEGEEGTGVFRGKFDIKHTVTP